MDIALRAVVENNKHFDLDYWVLRKSTNEQLASNLLGSVNFQVFTVKLSWKEIKSGKIAYNHEVEGEIERFKLSPRGQDIIKEYS